MSEDATAGGVECCLCLLKGESEIGQPLHRAGVVSLRDLRVRVLYQVEHCLLLLTDEGHLYYITLINVLEF